MALYDEFLTLLEAEDKEKCVDFCLKILKEKQVSVVTLYNDFLRRGLNSMTTKDDHVVSIWQEHVRSGIVRTVLECSYPFVCEEAKQLGVVGNRGKVIVLCPDGEFHEIGAKMVTDYFTLCGCETIFVGNNTPKEEFINAIDHVKPAAISIGVSNYYNIVAAQKTIELIRKKVPSGLKIYVGGPAFANNLNAVKQIGADGLVQSFEDIKKVVEGGFANETRA